MSFHKRLGELRRAVKAADYLLEEIVFAKAAELFALCAANPQHAEALRAARPDYGKTEFFLNVDRQDAVVYPPEALLDDFREALKQHEAFGLWFQEEIGSGEKPTLAVVRWLAHLVGLRHRCAHIFLDHPTLDEYTFVQLRSFAKEDSPGCFDIPVGGHVRGTTTIEETIREELKDELNLAVEHDLDQFCQIGDYCYYPPPGAPDTYNVEQRVVYYGRMKRNALSKMKFVDGEAAAICLFGISELKILLEKVPEAAASGLIGSFPVYLKHRRP